VGWWASPGEGWAACAGAAAAPVEGYRVGHQQRGNGDCWTATANKARGRLLTAAGPAVCTGVKELVLPARQHVQRSAPWFVFVLHVGPAGPCMSCHMFDLILDTCCRGAGGPSCASTPLPCCWWSWLQATREGACTQTPQGLRASSSTGRQRCRRRVREHGLLCSWRRPSMDHWQHPGELTSVGAAGAWACNLVRCIGHAHVTVCLPAAVHVAAAACAAPCWYRTAHRCSGCAMQPCVHRGLLWSILSRSPRLWSYPHLLS